MTRSIIRIARLPIPSRTSAILEKY